MSQTSQPAARAIIIHDGQLLVMHRNKFDDEYYTLIGGGIEHGETPEQALKREVLEETSLRVTDYRLVFIEEPGKPFGKQYIYLCEFQGGRVHLPADSIEAKISAMGQNLYQPMWLPLSELSKARFLSELLKRAIVDGAAHGFPTKATKLGAKDGA